jgi:glucosamine-phosphate N-acetyltransferase
MIIRFLTLADFKNGFLETLSFLSGVHLSPEEAEKILKSRGEDYYTYVILEKDQVIGTATLFIERKFIHSGGLVGHIEDVAIRPDWRNKNLGSMLISVLTSEAENLGCYKVILNCFDKLTLFYEKCGFKTHDVGMRKNVRLNRV